MIRIKSLGRVDSWHRPIYKEIDTGQIFVDIECGHNEKPSIYTISTEGEPSCPVTDFKIVEGE